MKIHLALMMTTLVACGQGATTDKLGLSQEKCGGDAMSGSISSRADVCAASVRGREKKGANAPDDGIDSTFRVDTGRAQTKVPAGSFTTERMRLFVTETCRDKSRCGSERLARDQLMVEAHVHGDGYFVKTVVYVDDDKGGIEPLMTTELIEVGKKLTLRGDDGIEERD